MVNLELLDRREVGRASVVAGLALVVAVTAFVAMLTADYQLLLFIPLAVAAAAMLVSATWRICVVIFGGMLVLQSTQGVTPAKLAYFAAYAVCVLIALARAPRILRQESMAPFRRLPFAAFCYGTYLLLTVLVAVTMGTGLSYWGRDVVTYGIIATAPMIALDAASEMTHRAAVRLTVIVGAVAVAAFTAAWISRRGVSSLPFDRVAFSSFALCFVPFAYGFVRTLLGPRRIRWGLYAAMIPAMLLVTGTRSTLILAVALLAVVGSAKKARVDVFRLFARTTPLVVACVVAVPILAGFAIADPEFIGERVQSGLAVVKIGPQVDQSFQARQLAYEATAANFREHPVFGVGPGHLYPTGVPEDPVRLTADSPVVVLSRFGVVGAAALLAFFVTIILAFRNLRRRIGYTPVNTTARCALWLTVALVPFGAATEDKGFGLGLMLILLLAMTLSRETVPLTETTPKLADVTAR